MIKKLQLNKYYSKIVTNILLLNCWLFICGCSMNNSTLEHYISWRDQSFDQIKQNLAITDESIDYDANYQGLSHVTELHNSEVYPGYFYFKDQQFLLLYIGDQEVLAKLDPKLLEKNLGNERVELRSRAGKEYTHLVYPEAGVAFSTDGQEITILEIFPPTSLAEYKANIYQEVTPFYK